MDKDADNNNKAAEKAIAGAMHRASMENAKTEEERLGCQHIYKSQLSNIEHRYKEREIGRQFEL